MATRQKSSKEPFSEKIWKTGWTYIRNVVDTAREPFLVLDENLIVLAANESYYRTFDTHTKETEGKYVYDLGNGQWAGKHLRTLLNDILPDETFFRDFEVEHEFPIVGKKIMVLNARRVYDESGNFPKLIVLAMEDVTKQRDIEARLKAYSEELEKKVSERTADLSRRIEQLEHMNKMIINRELKMIELKGEISDLKKKRETEEDNGRDRRQDLDETEPPPPRPKK